MTSALSIDQHRHAVQAWRSSVVAAADGAAFSIPLSLGSAALIFSRTAPDLLASGVLALMLALLVVHLDRTEAAEERRAVAAVQRDVLRLLAVAPEARERLRG